MVFFAATGGPAWRERANWTTATPVCEWSGVTCSQDCRVEGLRLPSNGLVGTIPAELAALTALTALDLSANALSGSLDARLSAWSALAILDLSGNMGLSGTLEPSFAGWTSLQSIALQVPRQRSACAGGT